MMTNVLVAVLAAIALGVTIWANWGNNQSEDQTDKAGKKDEEK